MLIGKSHFSPKVLQWWEKNFPQKNDLPKNFLLAPKNSVSAILPNFFHQMVDSILVSFRNSI